jgi:hypothetical protein
LKISGFNERGEARITDDHGRVVGYGELRLEDAHLTGIERGDRFPLELVVTWTTEEAAPAGERAAGEPARDLPDPDDTDFDGLDWGQLLR